MKILFAAATLGAALAVSGAAVAQPYYYETERAESVYQRPSDRANSSVWAAGDTQIHSTPAMRAAYGMKNNFSQDGTSQVGGGAMTGPSTRLSQAFGAAAGGSTGGVKSGGD